MNTYNSFSIEVSALKQQHTLGDMWFSFYNKIPKVFEAKSTAFM